jgi:hypothetical protein
VTHKYWTVLVYTGCNRRNGPDFGRVFLRSNCTDITQKHLYPKLNGYRDIGQRKEWTYLVSAYCTRFRDVILPSP